MHDPIRTDPLLISRRHMLRAGAILGAAALGGVGGGGCASGRSGAAGASLPGPVVHGNNPSPAGLPPATHGTPAPSWTPGGGYDFRVRSAWTSAGVARPLNARPMGVVTRLTVHHDGMGAFTSESEPDAARRLENIRRAHLGRVSKHGEPWADIGYHFAIDPAGRVWEARPLQHQGAHVDGKNEQNLGIVVLGNYDRQGPNRAQAATIQAFVADQMRRFGVPLGRVYTHQELDRTACPGSTLQRLMIDVRSPAGPLRSA